MLPEAVFVSNVRKNLFLFTFLYNRHARVAHKYDSGVNFAH